MPKTRLVHGGREPMTVYPVRTVTDNRGNNIESPDMSTGVTRKVNVSADRPTTATIPGQIDAKILRVIAPIDFPVDSWCRVEFRGEYWDVAQPVTFSRFTRALEHVEFILRSRNEQP